MKNPSQAAQLATYRVWDSRELAPITLTCQPRLRHYRPGECLAIDVPELGLDTNAIILRRQLDPVSMKVTLTLVGETMRSTPLRLDRRPRRHLRLISARLLRNATAPPLLPVRKNVRPSKL
ncbi:hypothetical protein HME9302_00013 [Alteripontixanthobacter maritimus]|uniref:Uncharacterized protein n=1 Tax=Alteripontixanthobacter maritimus TaxID=2161824 RepID=A0A369QQI2_9SPHN|nr:hypothetical protein HME9302_00013 [Alteripontixanthobacter maritimus]